jgi:Tol biopolymer transport system component
MGMVRTALALGVSALLTLTACGGTLVVIDNSGALRVTLSRVGVDFGPGFLIQVDGGIPNPVSVTRTLTVRPGRHMVTLAAVPANCTVSGDNPRAIDATGPLTEVNFEVTCVAVKGSLAISLAISGIDGPAEYAVSVDGGAPLLVREFGWLEVGVGSHTVGLSQLPPNCAVSGEHPRAFTIPADALTTPIVTLELSISCTAVTALVEISTTTLGEDPPWYGLALLVDEVVSPSQVSPNGTTQLILPVGEHTLRLGPLATNCTPREASRTVTLQGGGPTRATVPIGFTLDCVRTERIAFTRWTQNNVNLIEVANVDGSGAWALAEHGLTPSWAPDGTRLVFQEWPCSANICNPGGLTLINADGTGRRALTTQFDRSPSWSPDGSTIVFSRVVPSLRTSREVFYLIDADGSRERTFPLPAEVRQASSPAWSPDGSRIVFSCQVIGVSFSDLCIVGVDGTGFARLTNDSWYEGSPRWSPDGSRIVFSTNRYDPYPDDYDEYYIDHVAVIEVASGAITDLGEGYSPAWSRDGSRIAYVRDGIYVMRSDGSGATRVINRGGEYWPVWRP